MHENLQKTFKIPIKWQDFAKDGHTESPTFCKCGISMATVPSLRGISLEQPCEVNQKLESILYKIYSKLVLGRLTNFKTLKQQHFTINFLPPKNMHYGIK